LVLLFVCCNAFPQNPDSKRINHWYFGHHAGLDFSSGTPVPDSSSAMFVWTGNTTMSDTSGNLLFYSDGEYVWNALHDTMPNGFIDGIQDAQWAQQSVIAIPDPGNADQYYIFTNRGSHQFWEQGIQYHIVDMSLDNGFGDVIQTNIDLYTTPSMQMCGVRHGNSCDYWLITHDRYTNEYVSFLINDAGVDHTPVLSPSGVEHAPYYINNSSGAGGQFLKASPQGDKLVSTMRWYWQNTGKDDELHFSSFDKFSGVVSGSFIVQLDSTSDGSAFSPSGELFYAIHGSQLAKLAQFELSPFDSISVNMSKSTLTTSASHVFATDMRIGPDGKLYGGNPRAEQWGIDSLPVIHVPDAPGTACMFDYWGQAVNGVMFHWYMPSYVEDFAAPMAPAHVCNVGIESANEMGLPVFRLLEDELIIQNLPAQLIGKISIHIYNMLGQVCTEFNAAPVDRSLRVNVSSLSSGLYIVGIIDDKQNRIVQGKIVKP